MASSLPAAGPNDLASASAPLRATRPAVSLVVMGVAGCGKSSAGQAMAAALGLPLIEGDDFHGPDNQAKMSAGVALTDEDREGWLATLAAQLAARPEGVVLTCSALKRAYRDRLRAARPGLRFVHLVIDEQTALSRVQARASRHFFGPQLVASQFQTLEDPAGEPGVLALAATLPLAEIATATARWLGPGDLS